MQTRSRAGTVNQPFKRYGDLYEPPPSPTKKRKKKISSQSEKKMRKMKPIRNVKRRFSESSIHSHSFQDSLETHEEVERMNGKEEEVEEEKVEEDEESKYERIRLENIKRNRELLSSLGLFSESSNKPFSLEEPEEKPKKKQLVKKIKEPIQRRSSARQSAGKGSREESYDPSYVCPLPTRNSQGVLVFSDLRGELASFRPNLTPKEILGSGSFGGAFFGRSETQKEDWKEFPSEWFDGLDMDTQVLSNYNNYEVNKYKVKLSFSSRHFPYDPRGWFQWYCRFYSGRRTPDDKRQIEWWIEKQGARKKSLISSITAAGGEEFVDDFTVNPMQRQHLLHLAYHLTEHDYVEVSSRKKGRPKKYNKVKKGKAGKAELDKSMDSITSVSSDFNMTLLNESQDLGDMSFDSENPFISLGDFFGEDDDEPEDDANDEDWK